MTAAALLLVLGVTGDPGEVVARLRSDPAVARVGEPVRWILEVEHPAGASVTLPETDPLPDDSWVLLEPAGSSRSESSGGREVTRATWQVISLEAGERALPTVAVKVEIDGRARTIETEAGSLSVRSALLPEENAPRPIRGFHPAPERASGRGLWVALGALGLLLLAIIGILLWRRARRRVPVAAAPTPLHRLAELQSLVTQDPETGRGAVYALTHLLRDSADRFLGEDRAALVDPEWAALREKDERLPPGVRSALARLLRDAERVKYALHAPTRFALEGMLADGRNVLEALASARKTMEKAA